MIDPITALGLLDEEDILLDEAALALAAVDRPAVELDPYRDLLAAVTDRLAEIGQNADSPQDRAASLAAVLGGEYGFTGDGETYDDPENADLIRVIDRRRGLPVSLSILYVAVARRLGWFSCALNIPGHVLVMIGQETPVVIDPFRGGRIVEAAELAEMVARHRQPGNLAVHQIPAMSNRAVLVRLLLNQATRAEAAGKGKRALKLYERMTAIAPSYANAWSERARLELIDDRAEDARTSLMAMLEVTRDAAARETILGKLAALAPS